MDTGTRSARLGLRTTPQQEAVLRRAAAVSNNRLKSPLVKA